MIVIIMMTDFHVCVCCSMTQDIVSCGVLIAVNSSWISVFSETTFVDLKDADPVISL